ncbi:MAG: hypothetical protein EOO75_17005 [Myxococcales bacterium]|nr:MAG: hypothetical protein EOO75_17005 [Myxococcales bacterium]
MIWGLLVVMTACSSEGGLPASSPQQLRYAAEAYARDDIPCLSDGDCCVVVDPCVSNALVVGVNDRGEVEQLLAEANDGTCTRCVAPAVQVRCEASTCVGQSVSLADAGGDATYGELSKTHCGAVALPPPSGAQMKVFGCGP